MAEKVWFVTHTRIADHPSRAVGQLLPWDCRSV